MDHISPYDSTLPRSLCLIYVIPTLADLYSLSRMWMSG